MTLSCVEVSVVSLFAQIDFDVADLRVGEVRCLKKRTVFAVDRAILCAL